jgi:hypothetical protein
MTENSLKNNNVVVVVVVPIQLPPTVKSMFISLSLVAMVFANHLSTLVKEAWVGGRAGGRAGGD